MRRRCIWAGRHGTICLAWRRAAERGAGGELPCRSRHSCMLIFFARFYVTGAMSPNSNSLPVALMQSLVVTVPQVSLSRASDFAFLDLGPLLIICALLTSTF